MDRQRKILGLTHHATFFTCPGASAHTKPLKFLNLVPIHTVHGGDKEVKARIDKDVDKVEAVLLRLSGRLRPFGALKQGRFSGI